MGLDSQLAKGVLEGCVLKLLENEFMFSVEIVANMRKCGFTDFSEGTLYPMLLRLEREGCFDIMKQSTNNSPPKKYYKLSDAGKEKLHLFENMWNKTLSSVNNVFQKEVSDAE